MLHTVLGVVDEGAEGRVGPPARAALAVLERLVLAAEPVVPVRPEALDAAAHGHRQRDALVQQAGRQRRLAEPRAPRHAHAPAVDLRHRRVQRVEHPVEAPRPRRQHACLLLAPCSSIPPRLPLGFNETETERLG